MKTEIKLVPAAEMAKRWGMSVRRVRKLCAERKISAARLLDGKWMVPDNSDRPVDGRKYRYRRVPKHSIRLVRHADAAVQMARQKKPEKSADERWLFFLRGSAYHLHTIDKSSLNFDDVCRVIAGERIEGKAMSDQEAVIRHCQALEHLAKAVKDGRRFTITLVREFYRILTGGEGGDRGMDEVDALVKAARNSMAHPIIKAGNFLTEMYIRKPLERDNERIGYLVANFLLMREDYPPIILFRRIFSKVDEYLEEHSGPFSPPPAVRSAFLNGCVMRAVCYSCRKDLLGLRSL